MPSHDSSQIPQTRTPEEPAKLKKILNLKLKTYVRNRDFIQLIQHHASQPGKYSAVCILLLIPAATNKQKLFP